MALPKIHRLVIHRQSIGQMRKKGKSVATPQLHAFFIDGENKYSRFGIIIGTHILKKAVARNKLRRMIQEALMRSTPSRKIDMVLFPKKAMIAYTQEDVIKEVENLLKKVQ